MTIAIILLLLVGAVVSVGALAYQAQNTLAPLRERMHETASNIATCISKRSRVLKQFLEITATYSKHEKELYERISENLNTNPQVVREALVYVQHIVSDFPQLRSDRVCMGLMEDLKRLEAELQQKFEEHNARVRTYNCALVSLPNSIFSSWMGFRVAQYLNSAEEVIPGSEGGGERPYQISISEPLSKNINHSLRFTTICATGLMLMALCFIIWRIGNWLRTPSTFWVGPIDSSVAQKPEPPTIEKPLVAVVGTTWRRFDTPKHARSSFRFRTEDPNTWIDMMLDGDTNTLVTYPGSDSSLVGPGIIGGERGLLTKYSELRVSPKDPRKPNTADVNIYYVEALSQ